MTQAIQVRYSCAMCGITDRLITVKARGDEDVKEWMDQTINSIAKDHAAKSPLCMSDRISNLKIPFDSKTPGSRVGDPLKV